MPYTVAFAPEAQDQLTELYHYIAHANAPVVAQRYVRDTGYRVRCFLWRSRLRDSATGRRPACIASLQCSLLAVTLPHAVPVLRRATCYASSADPCEDLFTFDDKH